MSQLTPQQMMEMMQAMMRMVSGSNELTTHSLQELSLLAEIERRNLQEIRDRFVLLSETDTRGIIQYANSHFCEVSGYTLEELIGKPHNIVRHPDMPKEVFKEFWDTIKAGKIWQGEIKNRRKDGSHYWVLATVGPILDLEGRPRRYVSMRVDITAQKDMEHALRVTMQEAQENLARLQENLSWAADIQRLLMPPLEQPEGGSLPYFILWRPKDYVSGDFAYIHEDKGRILFFIGDAMGHGVSGSFISTLFTQELRHLVEDKGLIAPELLADELDNRLGMLFRKRIAQPVTVDGTIALVDLLRKRMHYLSLKRRNLLYKDGELIELPAYPFSFGDLVGRAAEATFIDLPSNSRLYLYSDGVCDQHIQEGKRWGRKGWKEFVKDLQQYPFAEHKQRIEAAIQTQVDNHLQTDDMLIVGIEIP